MVLVINVDDNILKLDSEKTFFLTDEPNEEEKLFRKALGLPIKKEVRYYKDRSKSDSVIKVVSIRIIEMYEVTDKWFTLEICLSDNSKVKIQSAYLEEMQKSDFMSKKVQDEKDEEDIPADYYIKLGKVTTKMLSVKMIQKKYHGRFIAFDTETSGLSAETDRIIEIGAVIFNNGVSSAHFSSLINPHILTSPDAEKVNHISQEMINAAPPEESVFSDFTAFLGDALQGKTFLVAHNATFDRRFLEETLQRLGFDANLIFVDTLELSRKLIPGLKDYKLQTVAEHFDLNNKSAHRADSDAEICGMIFLKLLSKIQHETDNAVVKATQ